MAKKLTCPKNTVRVRVTHKTQLSSRKSEEMCMSKRAIKFNRENRKTFSPYKTVTILKRR